MAPISTPRPASYPLLIAIYIATLIGGIVLFYLLIYAAEKFFNLSYPDNSSMGFVLIMLAAMNVGSFWYNREQVAPSSGRKWTLAFLIAIVTLVVQGAVFYLIASVLGELHNLAREIAGNDGAMIAVVFAILWVVELLLIRAAIWWGVRNAAKMAARKASRG